MDADPEEVSVHELLPARALAGMITPVERCVYLQTGEIDPAVLDRLDRQGFDFAPVLGKQVRTAGAGLKAAYDEMFGSEGIEGGIRLAESELIGLVPTAHARSLLLADRPLGGDDPGIARTTVRPDTAVFDLLDVLAEQSAVLVIGEKSRELTIGEETDPKNWMLRWYGMMTTSDLNRPGFRASVYADLANLEEALGRLISRHFTDPWAWLERLSEDEQARIVGYWELAKRRGVDIGPVAACMLAQLLNIAAKTPELWRLLGSSSRGAFESAVSGIAETRNGVMHPVRPLVLRREDAGRLARVLRTARSLSERAAEILRPA